MSTFHCSCGFAINDAGEFGDHLGEVFERPGGLGTDGREHAELASDAQAAGDQRAGDRVAGDRLAGGQDSRPGLACMCGFRADSAADLDDHLLLAIIPPDGIGNDGDKHVPVDPSTPGGWYIVPDE